MTIRDAKMFLQDVVPKYLTDDTDEADCCKQAVQIAIKCLDALSGIGSIPDEIYGQIAQFEYLNSFRTNGFCDGRVEGLKIASAIIADKISKIEKENKGEDKNEKR